MEKKLQVGVVVGGGGAGTLAAAELFSFLDDHEIPVALTVGVSGGAVMAALRGMGMAAADITEVGRKLWQPSLYDSPDYRTILDIAGLPFGRFHEESALLRAAKLQQAYAEVFQDWKLEELRPCTVLQATDLASGQAVAIEDGLVAEAVYASAAQFPFMPPAKIGGRLFVDGSYISALPVLEAVKRRMDVILAISFGSSQADKPDGFLAHYWQFIGKVLASGERSQTALAIAIHHHETVLIKVAFDQLPQAADSAGLAAIRAAGQAAVKRHGDEILALVSNLSEYSHQV